MTFGKMMSNPISKQLTTAKLFTIILVLLGSITLTKICCAETKSDHSQLQQLLKPFSNIQTIKLPFQEKRFSLFLKQAKESHGFIEYTQPDLLIKHILSPTEKKYILKEEQLIIINDTEKKQQFLLDDYPQFKQFKALFSGLLQGKASKLTAYYNYHITELSENTSLLTLKSLTLDQFTQNNNSSSQKIDIIFAVQQIKKITISGFGGERSEMSFDKAIHKKYLSESL